MRVRFIRKLYLLIGRMNEEIKKKIDSLRTEVEDLIRQYDTEKHALTSASAKTSSDVTSKGIGFITEIVTDSSTLGRLGSKLSKAAMDDKRKQDLKLLDERFHRLLVTLVQKAKDSFSDVSIFKKRNPTPNSADLIRRFDKVQERSTIRGRASRLLQILAVLSSKNLIQNRELEISSHKEKQIVIEPGTPFSAKRDIDRILGLSGGPLVH